MLTISQRVKGEPLSQSEGETYLACRRDYEKGLTQNY